MKKLFYLAFFFASINLYAQKDEFKGTYSIKNEAGLFDFVNLKLNILNANMSNHNFNMSANANMSFIYNKIRGDINYDISYWNRIAEWIFQESSHNSIYKDGPTNSFRASIGYIFKKEEQKEEISVDLKQEGNTNYYTNIMSPVGYNWSLDLGFEKGVSYYYFGDNYKLTALDISTNQRIEIGSSTGSYSISEVGTITEAVSSYYNYLFLSLGVSKSSSLDMSIDFSDYGIKKSEINTRIYANLLFNLNSSFENINYAVAEYDSTTYSRSLAYKEYQLNDDNKTLPVGLRLGYEASGINGFGLSLGLEGGLFPGTVSGLKNNFFVNLKMGFSFGKRL